MSQDSDNYIEIQTHIVNLLEHYLRLVEQQEKFIKNEDTEKLLAVLEKKQKAIMKIDGYILKAEKVKMPDSETVNQLLDRKKILLEKIREGENNSIHNAEILKKTLADRIKAAQVGQKIMSYQSPRKNNGHLFDVSK